MPCPQLLPLQQYALQDRPDVQVTFSAQNQSRSESVVGVNPKNSQNMICASKKFIDPQKYHFTISASYTMNGGQNWTESQPPLQPGWDGMTDPDLTFDAFGNAYLMVEPLKFGADLIGMGMYVFKSADGGVTWGKPVQLHPDSTDDKQWIASDMNPASPYFGAIYAVWAAYTPLRFSRSVDHGATWIGVGNSPSGTQVFQEQCFAPSISIGDNGTIHVVWHIPNSEEIRYTRSTDGGNSFSLPTVCVTGVKSLGSKLPITDNWPHFPNATFRVLTLVTSCMAAGDTFIVAWADFRELVSRIYYRIALNGGSNWTGPSDGQALLPAYARPDQHHFHPQLSTAGNQAVGCAFYEFGLKNGKYLIDTKVTESCSDGQDFINPINVTDNPWDPAVNAPFSHSDPNVTFIGEYFGFDASYDSFAVVWTDTRTGVQELFSDSARLATIRVLPHVPIEVAKILYGVTQDGGGAVLIDGVIIHVPPGDPMLDILNAIAAIDAVKRIRSAGAKQAIASLSQIIANVAREEIER